MAEEICSAFVWKNSFLCISVQSHLHRMFWNKSYTIQPDLQSESSKIKSIFQHKSVNHTMHLILFSWLIKCMNFHTAMLGRMGIIFSQLFQKVHAFLMEMCNITLPVWCSEYISCIGFISVHCCYLHFSYISLQSIKT